MSAASAIAWKERNPERARQIQRDSQARRLRRQREEVTAAYGGACTCCGEAEYAFLTIDHVNNDGGGRDRLLKGSRLCAAIIAAGFPDEYTILCFNCNSGRALNGGICPHNRS